ncbi:LCP family protein [Microbacterium sp. KHB019]
MRQSTRATVARHGQQKPPSRGRRLLKALGIGTAVVLVAVLGVVAWLYIDLSSTYTENVVELEGDDPPAFSEFEGSANILVAGTDNCEPEYADLFGDRCTDAEDGVRSDVLMVVHISELPRRVTVISFPRDLLVDIPSCIDANGNATSEAYGQMINSAFGTGGLACSVKTVESLTGLDIGYAASINWGGVIDVTNAIGGVEVCLATPMKDADSGIDLPAGTHELKGADALAFLRARKSTTDGSDTARIGNQQLYMSSLVRKITSEKVLTDPALLLRLAKTILASVDPSTSLTNPVTLAQMGLALKDIPVSDYVFVQYPAAESAVDRNRLDPLPDAAAALFDALEKNEALALADEDEGGEPPATESPAPATPAPTASATPEDEPVTLPGDVTGTTGDTEGCATGRVY